MKYRSVVVEALILMMLFVPVVRGAERQLIHGRVPPESVRAQTVGRLPASTRLNAVISLPLRNTAALSNLLDELYRPGGTNFHQYLAPERFAELFGPTEQNYQAVAAFAEANGLTVTGAHPNRTLLDVSGSAADLEKAFHVNLRVYRHPTENRVYFAPDAQPSIDLAVPVLGVSGLANFILPRPRFHRAPAAPGRQATTHRGSAPDGSGAYFGNDFRSAYARGVQLTGAGQKVGLFELDGYYTNDITQYETSAGLPSVPLRNVYLDGFDGTPSTGNSEVALDIEMSISMAPGLAQVVVYQGTTPDDVLNRMATDNAAAQLSCSWGFEIDEATQQTFQQYAAQGQSFLLASGDSGAFSGVVEAPSDDPYITVVGGTVLGTAGAGGAWLTESAWDLSSGGISTYYSIPMWQQGVSMSRNGGSLSMRNLPDVALVSQNVWLVGDNGSASAGDGTSFAAPLWAGLTALVNEQAAAAGQPPVGFLNPAIYAVAKSAAYQTVFHDIINGNTTNAASPNEFYAVAGYDLCTGWGTPIGSNLINSLLNPPLDPLQIASPLGFTALGPSGGPFNILTRTYSLTNTGSAPLTWSAVNTQFWLDVSPSGGVLTPGGPAASVSVSLNPAAKRALIASYGGSVCFTNLTTGAGQNIDFVLQVGNGGFETGDLTDWALTGTEATNYNLTVSGADTPFGNAVIPGVDDGVFVHSGQWALSLGQNESLTHSLAHLAQTLPTQAGSNYLISFWLANIADPTNGVTPNSFQVLWNLHSIYNATDLPAITYTNMQFKVSATTSRTPLVFTFHNDPGAFGLDDITVQLITPPVIQSVTQANGEIILTWSAVAGLTYQVQYSTDLTQGIWTNLTTVTLDTPVGTASDPVVPATSRFYRVVQID
jgi:hypothetical protein